MENMKTLGLSSQELKVLDILGFKDERSSLLSFLRKVLLNDSKGVEEVHAKGISRRSIYNMMKKLSRSFSSKEKNIDSDQYDEEVEYLCSRLIPREKDRIFPDLHPDGDFIFC